MSRLLFVAICVLQMVAPARGEEAKPPFDPKLRVDGEEGKANETTLDPILITATRGEAERFELPYMADVVDERTITERGYRTTPQALREIPGVMVQETSPGQGSPVIRGFTGFRTLLLVDGIRLNNSTFREGPNQYLSTVDALSIERIEVVKGPSSVLYGSDAIGGTVNILTRGPNTYGDGFQSGGRGYYRFGSAENSHQGRGEFSATMDDHAGFFAGGTGKDFGDVIGGDETGRQDNTGYHEYGADAKFEYFFNDDTRIVLAHQRVRQNNVPRTHATVDSIRFHGSTRGTDRRRDLDQERELAYLQFHAENIEESFIENVRASLSWHVQDETEDRIRSNNARTVQGVNVDTLGFWVQAESPTLLGRFTYGIEYYRDSVESFSSSNAIQGPVGDDASYDMLGVFIQDQIDVGERLDVILGGRFNYAAAEANKVDDPASTAVLQVEDDWTAWVGSARMVYHLVPEELNIFGGVSQGYRAPNLSDLTRLDIARSGELEIPSPGLEPEYYTTYEVGIKRHRDWYSAEIAYFYTDIQEMIIRQPMDVGGPPIEVVKSNGGDGYVNGIELGAAVRPHSQWTLFGNFTWQEGEITGFPTSAPVTRTEYLSRVMPITANLGVRYDDPSKKWWAEFTTTIADEQDNLSSGDARDTQRIPAGGTPGYTLLNIRGGYRAADGVELFAGIENLADEDYRVHGSGSNGPGRNFIVGAEMRF